MKRLVARTIAAAPVALLLTALLQGVSMPHAGALFPGKNGPIVFASDKTGFYDIYTIMPNGKNLHRVTSDPALQLAPVWTQNRSMIIYEQCCLNGSFDIYSMRANGTGVHRLTRSRAQDIDPSVSKKGKIAFSRGNGGNYEIYVMDLNGSHVHRVTHNPSRTSSPRGTRPVPGSRSRAPAPAPETSTSCRRTATT